jgi:hypothetical protein
MALQDANVDAPPEEVLSTAVVQLRAGVVPPCSSEGGEHAVRRSPGRLRVVDMAAAARAVRRVTPLVTRRRPRVLQRTTLIEESDRLAPADSLRLANPLDHVATGTAAEAVPDAVVQMQAQRGRGVEVSVDRKRAPDHDRPAGALDVDPGPLSYVAQPEARSSFLNGDRPHRATASLSVGISTGAGSM